MKIVIINSKCSIFSGVSHHLYARVEIVLIGHFLTFCRGYFSPSAQLLFGIVQVKDSDRVQLGLEYHTCEVLNVVLPAGKSSHVSSFQTERFTSNKSFLYIRGSLPYQFGGSLTPALLTQVSKSSSVNTGSGSSALRRINRTRYST